MASSLIHICIAKNINEKLNLNENQLYLGSITPDINNWSNIPKANTHFSDKDNPDVPNVNLFLEKYSKNLNDPFVLGYFTHLYTDKMWYDKFIPSKFINNKIKLLNGILMQVNEEEWSAMMYHDFTALTKQLTNYFNLDISILYNGDYNLDNIIKEIPYDKLKELTYTIKPLLTDSTENSCCIFTLKEVINFIDSCTNDILNILKTQDIIS